jgi:DNA-directed RNA polymerase specialized sigma24 family protein
LFGGRHHPAFHQPPPERFERRDLVTLDDVAGLYVEARADALKVARRVLGTALADDVVQESFAVLLRRRHTFTHASLQYLLRVTKNLALDERARRGRIDYLPEERLILLDAQRQREARGRRVAPPPRAGTVLGPAS